MKICIIGCGNMANSTHLPSIQRYNRLHGGIDIAACADLSPDNARALAERYDIPHTYQDYELMLREHQPDAVVCLVHETAVAAVSAHVLSLGYPVLLEKPPGKTRQEVLSIAEASQRSGKPHMVAFNRRHMPVMTKLKSIIAGRAISHIAYDMYRKKRYDEDFEDTAIHAVDTVKWIAGSPYKTVNIFYDEMPQKGKNVANYFLYCTFESGTTAFIRILVDTAEMCERAEVHLDGEIVTATTAYENNPCGTGGIQVVANSKVVYTISGDVLAGCALKYVLNGFYDEHEHFYNCIQNGITPADDATSAVQNVVICQGIKNRERELVF